MSAAANAAGYLCAHSLLPLAQVQTQIDADTSRPSAKSRSLPPKPSRAPRIEYRKRRVFVLPAAA